MTKEEKRATVADLREALKQAKINEDSHIEIDGFRWSTKNVEAMIEVFNKRHVPDETILKNFITQV